MASQTNLLQRILARQNALIQGNSESIKHMSEALSSVQESFFSLRVVIGCIIAILCILNIVIVLALVYFARSQHKKILSVIENQTASLHATTASPSSASVQFVTGNSNFVSSTPHRMTSIQEVGSDVSLLHSSTNA